jgi:serine/threonine-protein kinase
MKRFGKYIVRGLLGRGGMSKVFKVEIPPIGKIVALKLLEPHPVLVDVLGAARIRDLFLSEAATLARLQHPHIVAIRDFDEAGGKPFYIMDYFFSNLGLLLGESRRTEEPSRMVRLDRAIDLIRQTLSGLACLHHYGIIHRDIKPFNLLLNEQGVVQICDFGLSRLRGETVTTPPHLKVGSPWYAAPEQEADPDGVDARADLYAVGVTLYRMLTGMLPAPEPLPPSAFNPDLDAAWDAFMRRALSRDPGERFSSAVAMGESLEHLERAWQGQRPRICRLAPPPEVARPGLQHLLPLRRAALKIDPRRARVDFRADGLWRPAAFVRNDLHSPSPGLLRDDATGLTWQQSGSPYPLTWPEAKDYAAALNRRRFAARTGWRLPTAPELMSLLSQTPHREAFCVEPLFDPVQGTLWSADRRSYTAAWFVNVEMGFVAGQDFSARCYVRAVCDDVK